MILVIGEILVDELPQGPRPGGAPFNVAQHLAQLGMDARLLSRVGCDEIGDGLVSTLAHLGMNAAFLQRDPQHATGRVQVTLSGQGIPAYTMVENTAYDHIDFQHADFDWSMCRLLCFGSLIQRSETGRNRLHRFLSAVPDHVLRLYDMNLRPGCDHASAVIPSLEKTDLLKLNDEELAHAGKLLNSSRSGDDLVRYIMDVFKIRVVALTKGSDGSELFTSTEKTVGAASLLSADEMADTVGAGDAFTAVFAWGVLQGLSAEQVLRRANALAAQVCRVNGAVPGDKEIYEAILKGGFNEDEK